MKDLAKRFPENPLLAPGNLASSQSGLEIICLLNPGAFRYDNKTWLLVRVAETTSAKDGIIFVPVIREDGRTEVIEIPADHPELINKDPRVLNYQGLDYLTTLSHLRLLSSTDGINFKEDPEYPPLFGKGKLEGFGIEDCRVTKLDDQFYLTYTAVSADGVGVGLRKTKNWKDFEQSGMIFPPHNKDCAIFEKKINGKFFALHRPSSVDIGGNYIWLAESPDGIHWGGHRCILKTRAGKWDNARVGAGAAPILTEFGWLNIYHGANFEHQYCLGAFLMDKENPSIVLSRSDEPIMIPQESYETSGFFGNVVFTNGHVLEDDGDTITMYYGAADEFVCGAKFSLKEILESLKPLEA